MLKSRHESNQLHFLLLPPVSFTNKTDCYDITEILTLWRRRRKWSWLLSCLDFSIVYFYKRLIVIQDISSVLSVLSDYTGILSDYKIDTNINNIYSYAIHVNVCMYACMLNLTVIFFFSLHNHVHILSHRCMQSCKRCVYRFCRFLLYSDWILELS
jgi:hypothetical protein